MSTQEKREQTKAVYSSVLSKLEEQISTDKCIGGNELFQLLHFLKDLYSYCSEDNDDIADELKEEVIRLFEPGELS